MFEATVVAHPGSHMTLEETILANLSAGTLNTLHHSCYWVPF